MAERRIFAGYYKRYDGKPIFVIRVLKDIDTGEAIVVCKDASFSREDNEHYYLIRYGVLLREGRGGRRAAGQIRPPDSA